MKNFTLSFSLLLFALLSLQLTVKAQTIILEQDGAQNEFVPTEWNIQGGGFANADQVNITSGGSGSLAISNNDAYTDISVEIHFSQTGTISFDLLLFAGGNQADAKYGNISDNTGAVNTAIVSFNNTSPISLNAIDFSNANMTVGIIYLKITGTEATSGLQKEFELKNTISANESTVFINSAVSGEAEIFSLTGQKLNSFKVQKGENEIVQDDLEGIFFVVLKNENGEVINKRKVALI